MKIAVKELKVKGIHCDPIKSEHYLSINFCVTEICGYCVVWKLFLWSIWNLTQKNYYMSTYNDSFIIKR
jgi:hypothetical protein